MAEYTKDSPRPMLQVLTSLDNGWPMADLFSLYITQPGGFK